MKSAPRNPITKRGLRALLADKRLMPIDGDLRLCRLSPGCWVYDEMLAALRNAGWVRFGPGFKAALYGKDGCQYCIKILGMGVGENPQYFCERGYYLEYERKMLQRFRDAGFTFGPSVLPMEEAIRLLVDQGGVSSRQAELRVTHHDVLVMEYLNGIPFATQTGHYINYELEIVEFDQDLLAEVLIALDRLRGELNHANRARLVHNDPMPPNIIFEIDGEGMLNARLVDFELAQDLNDSSPDYVNSSVAELYIERNVPRNFYNGKHVKNLDQYLMEESIRVIREFLPIAPKVRDLGDSLEGFSLGLGMFSFDVGRFLKLIRRE